jgi:hypothetical protein
LNEFIRPAAPPATRMFVPAETPIFSVPARHNPRLQALAERINADEELRQLWRSANINAVDHLGLGDCGEVHVRIVANAGLKLLRLLRDAGHAPAVVTHHRLTPDEAEVIVVLAVAVHDVGLAVHTEPGVAARAALVWPTANFKSFWPAFILCASAPCCVPKPCMPSWRRSRTSSV